MRLMIIIALVVGGLTASKQAEARPKTDFEACVLECRVLTNQCMQEACEMTCLTGEEYAPGKFIRTVTERYGSYSVVHYICSPPVPIIPLAEQGYQNPPQQNGVSPVLPTPTLRQAIDANNQRILAEDEARREAWRKAHAEEIRQRELAEERARRAREAEQVRVVPAQPSVQTEQSEKPKPSDQLERWEKVYRDACIAFYSEVRSEPNGERATLCTRLYEQIVRERNK